MHPQNAVESSINADPLATDSENIMPQLGTGSNQKSARKVQGQILALSKADARFWLKPGKLRKWKGSANYSIQIQFKGRRMAFSTGTGNKEAAARIAAGIYGDLLSLGAEGTLAKHRAQKRKGEDISTVGEYLRAAQGVMAVRPATFAAYAVHLRRIGGDILKMRAARRAKIKQKRTTRKAIEDAPLSIFTPDAVQSWRLAFVARARGDGARARSARISSNSIIRQARSLFARKVVKYLSALRLPDPLPFSGVEFFPRESMRYTSRIDAGILMRQAREELSEGDGDSFLVMLLALAAGLRRGEIDRLLWRNVDFTDGRIIVEESEHGQLKSEDSRGAVDIDPRTAEILRGFQAKARDQFVISAFKAGDGEASRAWGNRYRCGTVFEKVNAWLRAHGVEGNKALHTLRKEAGAIVATSEGIFAASQFLRHGDIAVTAAHYADKKTRTVIDMGALLEAGESRPQNVVPISAAVARRLPGRRAK